VAYPIIELLMQDMLASEMFHLISREADLSQTVVQYVKLQRAYHESALRILEEKIPELEKNISKSPCGHNQHVCRMYSVCRLRHRPTNGLSMHL
jgi:hypothetical protein